MKKELEAWNKIKRNINLLQMKLGSHEHDNDIKIVEKALTPPTAEEVCEALDKSFNINREDTDLHFIYDKESQEFRMVSQNVVYRYISTNRLDDDAIDFIDLDIEDIVILGRFYGGLI